MENKADFYRLLTQQAVALCEGEPNLIAKLANISALLNSQLEDINWVGFYLDEGAELVLGPFQGQPACVRIPYDKGVCGAAYRQDTVMRVEDVHAFEGHIACDAASNSEIVVPVRVNGQLQAVLDIDSPSIGRFDQEDEHGLATLVKEMQKHL
ncbi:MULTISPECIES: GAF domain-containing protein [Salinivibrio]|uniref:GAF domain-containing protein n=1 Tax=Salinivibrio kushneri TaxID=1908198 RepID=A0AB36K5Q5_9GAMM|nr:MULTISPECIES: GAF domain-containing protein [Salinivibrio]OOE34137.1 GAF domain-containing protein [Salinivibrio kushneri]OOE34224.1 GAF domain-containing protein [Salinivibrio kushneri]OOE41571.1 GAF domain-containing protein [Salinivibrio kushneri]OOE43504.1 GAF domain-containing protein [Salinivibrio kushneri]OOE45476.1 GAF domain-containing protein [Salinivibrio kushneri]